MSKKMRQKPNALKIYDALYGRLYFNKQQWLKYGNLKDGYKGEVWADQNFEKYGWLIIKGLSFHLEGDYVCQIDTIIITRDKIILYEVKWFSNPAVDRGNKIQFFSGDKENPNGEIYEHPREQLEKATKKFKRLMWKLGIEKELETYVMFTNPDFVLYGMEDWSFDLLFHSEIDAHLSKLAASTIEPDAESHRIYNLLMKQDHDTSEDMPFIPKYNYDSLRKVVKCPECNEVITGIPKSCHSVFCIHCHKKVTVNDILQKSLDDYKILFKQTPNLPQLHDWTGEMFDRMRIYRVLKKNQKEN